MNTHPASAPARGTGSTSWWPQATWSGRKEVLAKVQEENDHIDWSQVDVGEKEDE